MTVDEETLRGEDVPAPVDVPRWADDRMSQVDRSADEERLGVVTLCRSGEWVASTKWVPLSEAR